MTVAVDGPMNVVDIASVATTSTVLEISGVFALEGSVFPPVPTMVVGLLPPDPSMVHKKLPVVVGILPSDLPMVVGILP